MSSAPARHLSEAELRSLSHEELLSYTLKHLQSSPPLPAKRPAPESEGYLGDQAEVVQVARSVKKKKWKAFDMSRYGQRMIAFRLVYTGWRFHGFASQTTSENTVEYHLFGALTKTRLIESKETCEYSRSGRTDVGVSALGQVIGLRLRSNVVPPSQGKVELDYVKIINGNLPEGIRILAWTPVSDGLSSWPKTYPGDPEAIRMHWNMYESGEKTPSEAIVRRPGQPFSARFDAIHRSYKYFFVRGGLDINAMRVAAKHFEGSHDFRNFCRIDEGVSNFERLMYTVEVRSASDHDSESLARCGRADEASMYYIFVKGQAFLWHQVRCMSAVLFDVGMRREDPSIVQRMLEDPSTGSGKFSEGKPQYRMASPIPLVLYECAYPDSVLAFPQCFENRMRHAGEEENCGAYIVQSTFERADSALAKSYAETATQASILQAMLGENDSIPSWTCPSSSSAPRKSFKECRMARNFLLDLNKGRHVPYDIRPCDDSLEIKQQRAEKRRREKV